MKESVLDVLMYLFDHYLDDDTELASDRDTVCRDLEHAGFGLTEINKAFIWLEGLASDEDESDSPVTIAGPATRIYSREEIARLNLECRSFLLSLEQDGVLDMPMRELVIDRVMALDTDEIDLEELKWVTLMVLFNQPGRESVYGWMEDVVFDRSSGHLH